MKISSHLTTKEAAQASLVSRLMKHMWLFHPLLNFEDKYAYERLCKNYKKLIQERSSFIHKVDYIVKHHLGPVIDEFTIAFDLNDEDNHSHIDNWLVFAFAKQVKRLELDLRRACAASDGEWKHYHLKMPVEYQVSSNYCTFKSTLTSLRLVCVHLTTEVIESFLDSFPSLEILFIRSIHSFTSIRACSSLPLKHLEVRNCHGLDSIDLVVPYLLSFTCEGQPTVLHLRNASSLSVMSIGSFINNHRIPYTLDCLSIYCAQLKFECLELKSNLRQEPNLEINRCPVFTNVNHLTLNLAIPNGRVSILGWTPVVKACPVLQKLTLHLGIHRPSTLRFPKREIRKLDANPLSSLKTLEIVGFLGPSVNLELVMYVIENADMLEEIIVDAMCPYVRKNSDSIFKVRSRDMETHKVASELVQMLPRSVNLIFR